MGTTANTLKTVTTDEIDENGRFSILLPPLSGDSRSVSFGNYQSNDYSSTNRVNNTLTKITRLPDYFDTLPWLKCMFKNCTALTEMDVLNE